MIATASVITAARPQAARSRRRRRRRRGRAARAASSPRPPSQRVPQTARGRAGRCRGCAGGGRGRAGAEARQETRQDRPPRERFEGKGRDGDNRRDKFRSQQGRPQQGWWPRQGRARRPRFRRARQGRPRQARQRPVAPSMGDQRRPARARSSGRSQFAVRKTGGAEGATRRPQGLAFRKCPFAAQKCTEVYLERQRLDKWLWHARVVKARTCAAALVEAGHVRINGVREKAPGHAVKLGDVLTIGARSQRAHPQGDRIFRAARRRGGGARALRRFAERQRITICNRAGGRRLKTRFEARRFPCGSGLHALRKPRKI